MSRLVNVGTAERKLSSVAAIALAISGAKRGGRQGSVMAAAGALVAARALAGYCPAYKLAGRTDGRPTTKEALGGGRGIHVLEQVTIARPIAEVYAFWRDLSNLPRFLRHVRSVTVQGQRSHWLVRGPAGTDIEWDAEIIHEVRNKVIGWRTIEGAVVAHAGSVNFRRVPGGTRVRVKLQYEPPAGRVGDAVTRLLGDDPAAQIREDLLNVKELLETDAAPRTRTGGPGLPPPPGYLPVAAALDGAWAAARSLREARAISFRGRVVIVSGGSRGLGLLIARQLAAEGARLALLARDAQELARAAEDIEQRGGERPFVRPCDIGERLQAEQAVRDVAAHFGRIDVLINDAGIIEVGPVEHMTINDFEAAMAVHFWGPLYLTLAALPHLKERHGARLVNISSIAGRVAVPHLAPYSASKFALTGLSDALRAELVKDDVRVTTVLPWLMRTGSPFNAWFKGKHRAEFAWFAIFDSLPVLTADGEAAARRIVEACRYGDPEVGTAVFSRIAIVADAVFPSLMARSMALMNRLLPAPGSELGREARSGWQSPSRWAPSILTRLTERASAANNEVPR